MANLIVVLLFAAGFGFQFTTALYVQRVLGYDSLTTGLAFLPSPLMNALMSLSLAPRLTVRFGPRKMLIAGLVVSPRRSCSPCPQQTQPTPDWPQDSTTPPSKPEQPSVLRYSTLAASTTAHRAADGAGNLLALRDGYGAAWLAAAGFVLLAVLLSVGLLRSTATVVGRE